LSFSYTQNPDLHHQVGKPVFISTSAVGSSNFLMVNAPGRSAPLLIIGFILRKIGQSTVVHGALNTITITIATSDSLYGSQGTAVHLWGLTGSETKDGSLAIRGGDAVSTAMFQSSAQWTQSTGHLVILLSGDSKGYETYTLSFDLHNPGAPGQQSPTVRIGVTPYPLIQLMEMEKALGNKAPLFVSRYLYTPRIWQSTSAASNWEQGKTDQTNTISVTVSVNMQLTAGPMACNFTIKALPPTIAGSGTITAVNSAYQVALDTRASTTNDAYTGYAIRIRSQFVVIAMYIGLGRFASFSMPLAFSALAYVDRYILYNQLPQQIPLHEFNSTYLGTKSTYLGTSARYDSLQGLLIGNIVQTAEPGTELVFSFDVKNPPEGRFGSTVSISMCEMPWIAMQSGPGNFQPGLVSVFLCPVDV
jgi:hypothetical protein